MSGTRWGGSEELWHGTAMRMRGQGGHQVGASVYQWPDRPHQIAELCDAGCRMDFRPLKKSIQRRVVENVFRKRSSNGVSDESLRWLREMAPDLVLISQGFPLEGIAWMLACRKLGIRYASVIQAASEIWWPPDDMLDDLRGAYAGAAGLYFVSKANRSLMEMQCGTRFENASVVSNPWKVDVNDCMPWPKDNGMLELAFVGRMDPRAKGQDVLLDVLAMDKWRARPLRVNFYGSGPCEGSIRRLSEMLDLGNVRFHGQVSDIESIWGNNHALVLPSRFEGLPLVIVEAMLCGRMIITTDVAGNAEYLTDGVNGFVAAAPTRMLLDEAMERAWSARGEWKGMGENARKAVLASVPSDPIGKFANELISLVEADVAHTGFQE
jgi:glycosyltransferase involved in cell wall biosynthesis